MSYRPKVLKVQEDTLLPVRLLKRETAEVIFDMLHEGCSTDELYAELLARMRQSNKNRRPAEAKQRIDEILLNRWRYNPDIDEIAVERAYDGDREVWLNLTHYERVIVLDRLTDLWLGERKHRKWPFADQCNGVAEWALSVGESQQRITNRKGVNARRRKA